MAYTPVDEAYVLNRNFSASVRLNCQGLLWRDTLGFNLHPSIPIAGKSLSIADVATGTGKWLLEVANEVTPKNSNAAFDGYDISLAQCPPQQWVPANVKFQAWDMFGILPENLKGKYDIVHVRLVGVVVKDNDPVPVIKNLVDMLKPGGYLQWDETDNRGGCIAAVDTATVTEASHRLLHFMTTPKEGKGPDDWIYDLPKLLKQMGFEKADHYRYRDCLSDYKYWNDVHLLLVEEFVSNVIRDTPAAKRMKNLIREVQLEADRGAAILIPKIVCVARKKL